VADLTDAQKADVYFFCGQAQRFVQINTAIEQGIAKIQTYPAQRALLTNGLTDSPIGLLARARQHYDITMPAAYERLMALKVGPIELSGNQELRALADQGRLMVKGIRTIIGVTDLPGEDVFSTSFGSSDGGGLSAQFGGLLHQSSVSNNWVGG
jgi:hypothetical protein